MFDRQTIASKSVLLVGGTRFSGLYLWRELYKRGHRVTLFNRGKTEIKKIPTETDAEFIDRKANARFILGDRQDIEDMTAKLVCQKYPLLALFTPVLPYLQTPGSGTSKSDTFATKGKVTASRFTPDKAFGFR